MFLNYLSVFAVFYLPSICNNVCASTIIKSQFRKYIYKLPVVFQTSSNRCKKPVWEKMAFPYGWKVEEMNMQRFLNNLWVLHGDGIMDKIFE